MSDVKRLDLTGSRNYSDLIIGIDLGTTNSAVAIHSATAVPTLCPLSSGGKYTMPSCVRWDGRNPETNDPLFTVGEEAYNERFKSNVCYSIKRMMGSGDNFAFALGDMALVLSPAQISAEILKALKAKAQDSYPGVRRCIITVPAYFNQRQIEDTLEAAKIADLDCIQIFKEPTSASYIYSLLGYARDGSVLVYDLGGGTFDVTHMTFVRRDAVPKTLLTSLKRQYGIEALGGELDSSPYYCRVLGTYGDTRLGGDDIDREFARLSLKNAKDVKLSDEEFEELVLRCEQFKKNGYVGMGISVAGKSIQLSQEVLHQAIKHVFNKTMTLLLQIPKDELDTVNTIVLVGGSTKSDYLVSLLEDAFPGKEISRVLDPDATVALGAGALAKDLQEGKDAMYQDVLPMPIGILVDESTVEVCVEKNTAMPYCVTKEFFTLHDNQEAISIDVFQGISRQPEECTYLGRLRVGGLPQAEAGGVSVKVSFILSAQGRLKVTTSVNGVEEVAELIIDSLFNVTASETAESSTYNFDEFEQGIADLLTDNTEAQALMMERRKAIDSGDTSRAEELESQILDVL